MDRSKEKTTVPYPPVGADGGQSLSKTPKQSIAEEQTEHKSQERDFREIMRQMDRVNDPTYLPSLSMNVVLCQDLAQVKMRNLSSS